MGRLNAEPDVKTKQRDAMTQGGHAQLLADVDSFINSLQTPSLPFRSTSMPVYKITEGEPSHAETAEDATPGQAEHPAVALNSSKTRQGTIKASVDGGSGGSARIYTSQGSKAVSDHSHNAQQTPQQHKAAASRSCSNHMLSSAAANGNELDIVGHPGVLRDGQDGSKGISIASRSGGNKHQSRPFAETDQAVHKLHDLEHVAQASLDELESLLMEQQVKVST